MKERTFYILLSAVVALGVAMTAALVIYTAYEYNNCSIITYIATELW